MKRSTKIFLILALIFIVLGAVIFTAGIAYLDFDFTKLSTEKAKTVTYELYDDFDNIEVFVNTTDVRFEVAEDGKGKVVCCETDKVKHNTEIKDGTLSVSWVDNRKWYDYIGVNFVDMKITVYLPKTEYALLSVKANTGDIVLPDDVRIENASVETDTGDISASNSKFGYLDLSTDTGDITLAGISAGEIKLEADTGEIEISSVKCDGKITIESDTGDVLLSEVISNNSLTVNTNTGDVTFDLSDAKSIFVETDTGDVEGTLASDKVFITETSTGRVNVPKNITGGRCEIVTDTGDIEINIK